MANLFIDDEKALFQRENGFDVTIRRYVDSEGNVKSFTIGHEDWDGYTEDLDLSVYELKHMIIGLQEALDIAQKKEQA